MIISAANVLRMYDQCAAIKTPLECRDLAVRAVEPVVETYLKSYAKCTQIMKPQWCRENMAPSSSSICKVALVVSVGLFLWRIIK